MNVEILEDTQEEEALTQDELNAMCDDAIDQLENLSYNETVDVSLNEDCEGTD